MRFFVIATLAFLATLCTFCAVSACRLDGCSKPENASSTKCMLAHDVLDCTAQEIPAVVDAVQPLVVQAIESATSADGSVDWTQINVKSLGLKYGACILGNIFLTPHPAKASPGVVLFDKNSLHDQLGAQLHAWGASPTLRIHTAKGDL